MTKIYAVEFLHYTNCMNNCVTDGERYINIERTQPFLIREDDIEKYKHFGGGIRLLTFMGNMED